MKWLLDEKYGGEKSDAFFADCKRLALGEPLAYLIGFSPFLNCKIFLDSRPLIPRVETEFWVEEAITAAKGGTSLSLGFSPEPLRVLDMCAGSGCIGVALAKAIPRALVTFAEIDERHLPTIEKNIMANEIDSAHTMLVHSNLFSNVTGKYNFILSNPPYIDEALKRVDDSVVMNEPYVSLFGGEKGLDVISQLIAESPAHLVSGGQLWIEHEPEQTGAIHDLAKTRNFTVTTHLDQYEKERFSILVLQ